MTRDPTSGQHNQKSLYERLGGEVFVDAITMAFYTSVAEDKRLSHFFEDNDLIEQISHQRTFFTFALGGTTVCDENKLDEPHKKHNPSAADFSTFVDVLSRTLIKLEIEEDLSQEVLETIQRTAHEIMDHSLDATQKSA